MPKFIILFWRFIQNNSKNNKICLYPLSIPIPYPYLLPSRLRTPSWPTIPFLSPHNSFHLLPYLLPPTSYLLPFLSPVSSICADRSQQRHIVWHIVSSNLTLFDYPHLASRLLSSPIHNSRRFSSLHHPSPPFSFQCIITHYWTVSVGL